MVVDEHRAFTADAGALRLQQRQREDRRDTGIDRVAARLKDAHPDLGSRVMAGRYDPVEAADHRACRESGGAGEPPSGIDHGWNRSRGS